MDRKTRNVFALLALLGGSPAASAQAPAPLPPAAPAQPLVAAPLTPSALPEGALMDPAGQPMPGPGRLPPDPFAPQRMAMPMPAFNHEFAGGDMQNKSGRPDQPTLGIRLDDSYTFCREVEAGLYLSEHQSLWAAGATLLPFQSPCVIGGVRLAGVYNGNNSMMDDIIGASTDLWLGTRYKSNYFKLGYFVDWTEKFRKHGIEHSSLLNMPLIGNVTFDGSFGFGSGRDQFMGPRGEEIPSNRRIEIADSDCQIRLGKYLSSYFQTGFSTAWTNFRKANDENSFGAFANIFIGGTTVGLELTGGRGGLHGFVALGFNWGGAKNIDAHPIDSRYDNPIDTVSWVTRPTRRNITMRLRETLTGPGPDQVVPVVIRP